MAPKVDPQKAKLEAERNAAINELEQLKQKILQMESAQASGSSMSNPGTGQLDPSIAAILQTLTAQQQQQALQQHELLEKFTNLLGGSNHPQRGTGGSNGTTTHQAVKKMDIPKLCGPENLQLSLFRDWRQRWEEYSAAQRLTQDCSLLTQHGILRSALDSEWTILWNAGCLNITTSHSVDEAIQLMEDYLRKKRNPLLDRQEFHRRDQQPGESVDKYFAALKSIDGVCAYDDLINCTKCDTNCSFVCDQCKDKTDPSTQLQNIRLRDRLICGLRDKEMQKKVLAEKYDKDLTLEKVLSICSAVEHSNKTGDLLGARAPEINALKKSTYKKSKSQAQSSSCPNCGGSAHPKERCPARSKNCKFCEKLGHFQSVCRQRLNQSKSSANQKPKANPKEKLEVKQVGYLSVRNATSHKPTLIPVKTTFASSAAQDLQWLPDTGADIDAIGIAQLRKSFPDAEKQLSPDHDDVRAANGESLGPVGLIPLVMQLGKKTYNATVHVYKKVSVPLLSREGCKSLGLIDPNWPIVSESTRSPTVNKLSLPEKCSTPVQSLQTEPSSADAIREQILAEFQSTFNDDVLRAMDGPPMKIELIDGATPCKRYKAYTIPYHWRDSVKSQLEKMQAKDVIESVPVGEPIDWCHPIVVVPKKGSQEPRITVDLSGLNKFVRRPAYPTKVPREVVARIPPWKSLLHNIGCTTRLLASSSGGGEQEADNLYNPMGMLPLQT